jgi:DNA repair and recombination protein RAD52
MFTPEQIEHLNGPLDGRNVKTRKQAGQDLAYVEAWHVENEANRIFGHSKWDRFTDYECIGDREVDGKFRVYYRAKVRIVVRSEDEVTVREGCGFGSGIDRDLGQAHESALKEAESDAEKRALKTFGNPFGQALYDKTRVDVAQPEPAPRQQRQAPVPVEETGLFVACKAAIDMCNSKADLDRWAADNATSMERMKADSAPVYNAVRKYYASKLHSFAVKEAA